jgi:hypothetical protein
MAITINGSGTIGGVSVGGLPDGIVDTDMLASAAVTSAKVGTLGTSNLPAGSVIQVVQNWDTGANSSTTSTSLQSSGKSISITPTSSSSTIFVTFSFTTKHDWTSGAQGNKLTILRNGSTNLLPENASRLMYQNPANTNQALYMPVTITGKDSPATTSATSYTLYHCVEAGGTSTIADWGGVTMTVMEIAG